MKHININDVNFITYDQLASSYFIDFSVYPKYGFSGRSIFEISKTEFDELMKELKKLHETLSGTVEFRHWCDEYIKINSVVKKPGYFIVRGKIGQNELFVGCDEHPHLVFEFDIDQTELKEFINELSKCIANTEK